MLPAGPAHGHPPLDGQLTDCRLFPEQPALKFNVAEGPQFRPGCVHTVLTVAEQRFPKLEQGGIWVVDVHAADLEFVMVMIGVQLQLFTHVSEGLQLQGASDSTSATLSAPTLGRATGIHGLSVTVKIARNAEAIALTMGSVMLLTMTSLRGFYVRLPLCHRAFVLTWISWSVNHTKPTQGEGFSEDYS